MTMTMTTTVEVAVVRKSEMAMQRTRDLGAMQRANPQRPQNGRAQGKGIVE